MPSLPIRDSDKEKGEGIKEQQLEALAAVARDGGQAFLLWNNEGNVGMIGNQHILQIFHDYMVAKEAQKIGKTPARGSKSVAWSRFRPIPGDNLETWITAEETP